MHNGRNRNILLRCEDLKQEREAVVDGMVEWESDFLYKSNWQQLTVTNDCEEGSNDIGSSMQEWYCCPSRSLSFGIVDSIIRTNDFTHCFNLSSVFMHGATWDTCAVCRSHDVL